MPTDAPHPAAEFRRDIPWLLFLFAAVAWNLLRTVGHSPGVWVDTLIENLFVDDCLSHDKCTLVGAGATVGIFHSAGYFSWRSLLHWIGWEAEGTYHVFLFINTLGVVLVALAARRLLNPAAGVLAAILMSAQIGVPTQLDVISDVVPMPFLGAIFVLAAVTATTHPSLGMTAILGLIGGLAGNFYSTGLALGASALLISLMQRRRAWLHCLTAIFSFGISTIALSPGTWIVDAYILLTRKVGNGGVRGERIIFGNPLFLIAAASVALWLVSIALRSTQRRGLHVMAAIVLPLFIPLVSGALSGRLDAQPKYLSHVIAAASVGVAVPLMQFASWVWAPIAALRPAVTTPIARTWSFVPYVACLAIGSGATTIDQRIANETIFPFKYVDLTASEQLLAEHGWSWTKAARNLKAVDDMVRRAALRWVPSWPTTGQTDNDERAYLLKVPSRMVPLPLPPNVTEVRHTQAESTLVTRTCSWIDWSAFTVCTQESPGAPEKCVASGLPANPDGHSDWDIELPGMPRIDIRSPTSQVMTIHLPLKPRASCPEEWIYLPRQPGLCRGTIVSVDGGSAGVEDEGRWARLRMPENGAAAPKEVAIQWMLGGPNGCSVEYRGYPPFFVEGDPKSAAFLSLVMERQWEFR